MISGWIMLAGAGLFMAVFVAVTEYTRVKARREEIEFNRSLANDRRLHPQRTFYQWGRK